MPQGMQLIPPTSPLLPQCHAPETCAFNYRYTKCIPVSGLCVLLRFPPFARGACHSWQFLAEKFLAQHRRGQEG